MTTPLTGMYGSMPSAAAASGTSSATTGGMGGTALSQNNFLSLLVSELQNQNPLQPMSSSSFITQMATLTQVSAIGQMSTAMTDLLNVMASSSAVALVGKSVTLSTGNATVTGTVTGVEAGAAGPQVVVGGTAYALSNVVSVGTGVATASAPTTATGGTAAGSTGVVP